ncbi:DUF4159 domain-containing protein [Marinibaculum pumilum]|uniref:DUF4159 domain-containing protein n=1 Tax=Marinibaculum pumilum TaxID=1766165 RepID=A0ABV7L5C6_9PROT
MLSLGPLAFAAPWLLLALAALPVLWWLLRVTPPAPREQNFPAIRLLLGMASPERTPAHTPLWLLLLRMLAATLAILALAQPLLNPDRLSDSDAPLTLVVDDGWAAAPNWSARIAAADATLAAAERAGRPARLLTTAPRADGAPTALPGIAPAGEVRTTLAALQPKPWPSDHRAVLQSLGTGEGPASGEVVWYSDGIESEARFDLAERLQWLGPVRVVLPEGGAGALLVQPPRFSGQEMQVNVQRPQAGPAQAIWLRALGERGQVLGRAPVAFEAGGTVGAAAMNMPGPVRNQLSRLELEAPPGAGAAFLLDERYRRRTVGIVADSGGDIPQPLLSEVFYVDRALQPHAEIRIAGLDELLPAQPAILILADVGQVVGPDRAALADWLDRGGMLVRFAGPRLAAQSDELTPVRLRSGGRDIGGALSWSEPARLAPFAEGSPFYGLSVPDDVSIHRQVLAEPDLNLSEKTWARLTDGTPLVTAEQRGDGWLVLFHTTANTEWSNLPLSGLFVQMLLRLVELSQGMSGAQTAEALPPLALLDGFGRTVPPGENADPLAPGSLGEVVPGPAHPPGLYGTRTAASAINLGGRVPDLAAAGNWPVDVSVEEIRSGGTVDLLPWLLLAAMLILVADLWISLWLRGALVRPAARQATLALLLAAGLPLAAGALPAPVAAQSIDNPTTPEELALAATLDLRLAYVRTGDAEIDEMSEAGMRGLSQALLRRSSVEPADPIAVDLESDEIAFFPFLYWPMAASQPDLSEAALAKVDQFMKTGGLILFDTRDQGGFDARGAGPGTQTLRRLLGQLDVPPLTPVPPDHVLTKAFYLLQEFPGRYTGGKVWVERANGAANDGVSPLVIGGHDWGAAWAVDEFFEPVAAVVPGDEAQREYAYRFGVNLIMYALTGNYKADQVHVPALLERLGQ